MRWWIVMLLGAAALLAVSACKVKKKEAQPGSATETSDAPAAAPSSAEVVALRDEVVAKVVFWGRPEYTPHDWAIIDPAIAAAIASPDAKGADHAALVERAGSAVYRAFTRYPEGLKAIEQRLTERYNHPVITRDDDLVRIDLGVIGGSPRYYDGRSGLTVSSAFAGEGGAGITGAEVLRNLQLGMSAQPGAHVYQVEVDVPFRWPDALPRDWSKGGYTYVYAVAEDRIRVYATDRPDAVLVTRPLGNPRDPDALKGSELEQRPMDAMPVRSFDLRRNSR